MSNIQATKSQGPLGHKGTVLRMLQDQRTLTRRTTQLAKKLQKTRLSGKKKPLSTQPRSRTRGRTERKTDRSGRKVLTNRRGVSSHLKRRSKKAER